MTSRSTVFGREDYAQAESLYREALAIQVRVLGDEHPEVASTLENLGGVYFRTKRYDETLRLLDQVLAMRRKMLGDNHTAVGRTFAQHRRRQEWQPRTTPAPSRR